MTKDKGKPARVNGKDVNKMTNKEYKDARDIAENAPELSTFEHYNGWYIARAMDANDAKEMRKDYKTEKKINKAFALDGFNNRALVIPTENGYKLKSYYTDVAEIVGGDFVKTWDGYSVTTMKHINAFREYFGFDRMSKREWIETK